MSKSQNNNIKNKQPRVGDVDVSKIDDKAGIHSTSDSTRHIERAQKKQVEIKKANQTGSWQINEKTES